MSDEVIDMFCHWLPAELNRRADGFGGRECWMFRRAASMPVMTDLSKRFALMDRFAGYRQVPSLASPPLESVVNSPNATRDLSRIANDLAAQIVSNHSDRFPTFVAALPMDDPQAACAEMDRAVRCLGAAGAQVFTNVEGAPLDEPRFACIFETAAALNCTLWLHPARGIDFADYPSEQISKHELWWAFGWPYETGVAMARLAIGGLFDRWPQLRIITHHVGGIVPMLEGRLGALDPLGTRTAPEHAAECPASLSENPRATLRRFYADTASFGSSASIACGCAFFGAKQMVFATDMPFGGPDPIARTLSAVAKLSLSPDENRAILSGNAKRIINPSVSPEVGQPLLARR